MSTSTNSVLNTTGPTDGALQHGSDRRRVGGLIGAAVQQGSPPLMAVVSIVLIWQGICSIFSIPKVIVPSPVEVFRSIAENWASLLENCVPTIEEAAAGFGIGSVVALASATLFVHVAWSRRTFYPLAILLQSVPIVAVAPILVVSLGTGFASKVVMAALISFFPALVNTTRGLTAVKPALLELFASVNASRNEVFWKLRLPNAGPYIFLGFRVTASASVIGAIIAEWIGASRGLGFMVINATYEFNTPLLWATILISALVVLVAFGAVVLAERVFLPWERGAKT